MLTYRLRMRCRRAYLPTHQQSRPILQEASLDERLRRRPSPATPRSGEAGGCPPAGSTRSGSRGSNTASRLRDFGLCPNDAPMSCTNGVPHRWSWTTLAPDGAPGLCHATWDHSI